MSLLAPVATKTMPSANVKIVRASGGCDRPAISGDVRHRSWDAGQQPVDRARLAADVLPAAHAPVHLGEGAEAAEHLDVPAAGRALVLHQVQLARRLDVG